MEIVHRSCPICEASCGLRYEIDRDQRRVLSVRDDEEDPELLAVAFVDAPVLDLDAVARVLAAKLCCLPARVGSQLPKGARVRSEHLG